MNEKFGSQPIIPTHKGEPLDNREQAIDQVALLEKLNQALANEVGSKMKWKRPLDGLETYGKLKGEVLVMVDDSKEILEAFAPHMMAATEGEASFIRYRNEDLNPLVDNILQRNPSLVVLDYSLPTEESMDDYDVEDKLNGAQVARALRARGFNKKIVGFSSQKSAVNEFTSAGADGAVEKDAFDIQKSVEGIAALSNT